MSEFQTMTRAVIDELDEQIIDLLCQRFDTVLVLALHQSENNLQVFNPARIEQVRQRYVNALGQEDADILMQLIVSNEQRVIG